MVSCAITYHHNLGRKFLLPPLSGAGSYSTLSSPLSYLPPPYRGILEPLWKLWNCLANGIGHALVQEPRGFRLPCVFSVCLPKNASVNLSLREQKLKFDRRAALTYLPRGIPERAGSSVEDMHCT